VDHTEALSSLFCLGIPGPDPTPADEAAIRDLRPSVFILFSRNLRSESQVRDLAAGLREVSEREVLLAVDQEGGRVNRLESLLPGLSLPAAYLLARLGPVPVRDYASATGRALAALGLDWNLAPVLDLDRPGSPNGIGDRAFGTDPGAVSELAAAFLDGLEAAGTLGCLKHFPGLGGTALDTHRELAVCERDAERLWREDVEPFRRLASRADAVMVGHAAYPAVTGRADLPAGQSRRIVGEWLRRELGFEGAILSDDLEMGALRSRPDEENARAAVEAGCDLLLFCHQADRARRSRDLLDRDLRAGRLAPERVRESSSRIAALRRRAEKGRARREPGGFAEAGSELERISRRAGDGP
jgi:beta-N-acetylhexosaminidase